jgi:hypothetical protein
MGSAHLVRALYLDPQDESKHNYRCRAFSPVPVIAIQVCARRPP